MGVAWIREQLVGHRGLSATDTVAQSFSQSKRVASFRSKRPREVGGTVVCSNSLHAPNDAVRYLLSIELSGHRPVRHVTCGLSVESSYGCSYHLYTSESIADDHGAALAAVLSPQQSAMSVLELCRLMRIASGCRKSLVLVYPSGPGPGEWGAVEISYARDL
jgi:hypothetical protein